MKISKQKDVQGTKKQSNVIRNWESACHNQSAILINRHAANQTSNENPSTLNPYYYRKGVITFYMTQNGTRKMPRRKVFDYYY